MFSLNDFKPDFSTSAFRTIDGTRCIIGKFCEIEAMEDCYDIWLVTPGRDPIGARKLNNLAKAVEALPQYTLAGRPYLSHMDGEAYLQTTSPALVREVAFIGGVKRRKRYSGATRQANAARLAKYRGAA